MLFPPQHFCTENQLRVWRSNNLEMQSGKNKNNKESMKGIKPLSFIYNKKYFNNAFIILGKYFKARPFLYLTCASQ